MDGRIGAIIGASGKEEKNGMTTQVSTTKVLLSEALFYALEAREQWGYSLPGKEEIFTTLMHCTLHLRR